MKITMYELLGMVKDEEDRNLYVKYFDRVHKKEDKMWACKENIIYKLDQLNISLNDEVEILEEDKKIKPLKTLRHSCNFDRHEETLYENEVDLARKITELIDEVNKLKEGKE